MPKTDSIIIAADTRNQDYPNLRVGGFKHGHSTRKQTSLTYSSWEHMNTRCQPNYFKAHLYSEKGISVCDRWRVFEHFLADVGERPSLRYTLDRYPNKDGNYEPGNVRWATYAEQNRNHNRNRLITFRDETKCLMDWASSLGLSWNALAKRLRKWPIEKALTTPRMLNRYF